MSSYTELSDSYFFVQCNSCKKEIDGILKNKTKKRKEIIPPKSWYYVFPAKRSKDKNSVFACSRWCARTIMAELAATTEFNQIKSWCELTQIEETYSIIDKEE